VKNVFISAGDRSLGSELLEQLRIYGITVRDIENIEDITRLVASLGTGLLLMEEGRLDEDPGLGARILSLKERLGDSLRVLFYSERDDFEIRLKTVRAGGEAFFQLPMDASILAGKIDALFGEGEDEPYRVLIVDDDPEQVAYNSLVLERAGMVTAKATEASQVIPLIVDTKPDIILMDMYMPSCTGAELAAILRQNDAFAPIPIVFLSVEKDFEKQIRAIRKGGDEFLEKPIKPEHLVSCVAMRAERMRSVRFYMERDNLTGLLNHSNLVERLSKEVLRARRAGDVISFAKLDIDHFAFVNESYGHLSGDRVLQGLSRLLVERLRRTDIVGRYGGEEFGVILTGSDIRSAARLVEELRESFSRLSFRFDGSPLCLTFSAGISSYPDFVSPSDVIEAADRALRRAKEGGRDMVVVESTR